MDGRAVRRARSLDLLRPADRGPIWNGLSRPHWPRMEEMNTQELMAQLSIDEFRSKKIYQDTRGKITGGVGRNLTDRGFNDDEIDLMLQNDVRGVLRDLDRTY